MDKFLEYAPLVVVGIGALSVKAIIVGFTIYNTFITQMNRRQLLEHKAAIKDLQEAPLPATDEKNVESAS